MDGIHDLGGKHGYGEIVREPDEPTFHQRWEARVFAMMRASVAHRIIRNSDQFRHAIECIDPAAYLTHGYYGRWLGGVEMLLCEAGVIDRQRLLDRIAALGGDPDAPAAARPRAHPDTVNYEPAARDSRRDVAASPRFRPGDRVRTVSTPRPGHTRLPAYARGRVGVVCDCHGGWVLPDSNAHGRGEQPQHLYTVAFDSEALWGDAAEPGVSVRLDLFDSYLEVPDE